MAAASLRSSFASGLLAWRGIADQALLPGPEEGLGPFVVQARRDPPAPAMFRDTLLAGKTFEQGADPLFGRMLLSGAPPDLLLGRRLLCSGSLSHPPASVVAMS